MGAIRPHTYHSRDLPPSYAQAMSESSVAHAKSRDVDSNSKSALISGQYYACIPNAPDTVADIFDVRVTGIKGFFRKLAGKSTEFKVKVYCSAILILDDTPEVDSGKYHPWQVGIVEKGIESSFSFRLTAKEHKYIVSTNKKSPFYLRLFHGFSKEAIVAKALEKQQNSQLRFRLNSAYRATYAHEYTWAISTGFVSGNENIFEGFDFCQLLIPHRHQLANLLGITEQQIFEYQQRYGDCEWHTVSFILRAFFRNNLVTHQMFFDLLINIPSMEFEPEFHRIARRYGVKLPAHWNELPDIHFSLRPVVPNFVQIKPNDFRLSHVIMPHCVSLAVSLELSSREFLVLQHKARDYGTRADFKFNRLPYLMIEYFENKEPLNWQQLFTHLDAIPDLRGTRELRALKNYFKINEYLAEHEDATCDGATKVEGHELAKYRNVTCLKVGKWKPINLLTELSPYFYEVAEYFGIDVDDAIFGDEYFDFDEQVMMWLFERLFTQNEKMTWKELFSQLASIPELSSCHSVQYAAKFLNDPVNQ
ncbi:hypothetical protein D5018_13315 [Parashewanella curva]|uniref:Uncharacterized protein n=1 Tax=Parashewanella curva TaxID=2338552 RepID=A0A3L8PUW2_9GAMM|nr:hypothetical protein [Parashewanella curva]RLV59191.1 hypothetical protein D5018_13315 [Parashewanella curva]